MSSGMTIFNIEKMETQNIYKQKAMKMVCILIAFSHRFIRGNLYRKIAEKKIPLDFSIMPTVFAIKY